MEVPLCVKHELQLLLDLNSRGRLQLVIHVVQNRTWTRQISLKSLKMISSCPSASQLSSMAVINRVNAKLQRAFLYKVSQPG